MPKNLLVWSWFLIPVFPFDLIIAGTLGMGMLMLNFMFAPIFILPVICANWWEKVQAKIDSKAEQA